MNITDKDTFEQAAEAVWRWFEKSVEQKGYYPFPMIVFKDGGLIEVYAIDLPVDATLRQFVIATIERNVRFAFLGLDRTTKPGQGTEFADILTVFTYERAPEFQAEFLIRDQYRRCAVLNYQFEPRIIRPFDWENKYWTEQMLAELHFRLPNAKITRRVTVH